MRRINDEYTLHPDTEEDVKKIIEAFKKSGLEYQEFATHMDVKYPLIYAVFHEGLHASPYFRSRAQDVLNIELGVERGLPKRIGRTPKKPPFQRKFTCPFCHKGDFSIFKARSKYKGICVSCGTRVAFVENLETMSRTETITLALKKNAIK